MQKCKECGEIKVFINFHPYNKSVCKKCLSKRTVLWMKNHPERTKEIIAKQIAKRKADPNYKKNQAAFYREWYAKNGRKRAANYIEYHRNWKRANQEKVKVHTKLRYAIKKGLIKIAKFCEECKEKRKLVGHHPDYRFPLKVNWLCYSCHKKIKSK